MKEKESIETALDDLQKAVHIMMLGFESGIDDRDYAVGCMSVVENQLSQILSCLRDEA